ncbi:MAG: AI-2E family transporter [Ignavibacteriae bacterium]|nr:MAG: AI-2E family transporter [Ignavibacteriota bacterium]
MHGSTSISNKPFIKVVASLGLIILLFWIASFFPDLVLTLILSSLIAFILRPFVRFLEFRFNLKRGVAIALVFIFVGGIGVFTLIETIPILVGRLQLMYEQLRHFPFEAKLTVAAKELAVHIPFVDPSNIEIKVHEFIQQLISLAGDAAGATLSYLANLAIVPFITYFILAEGDSGLKTFVEGIPNKYFEMSLNIMDKVGKELVFYLRGLILECSIVGGLSIIGFMIIGVPYAIIIGILTGIANLVPYLGPITGASLALIVSLTVSGNFQMLLPIFILSVVIRLIDDLILQPICFGKSLDMHPVAVVLTLIIGHQLMGVSGMIISIPIATILRVSAVETYWGFKHYSITA